MEVVAQLVRASVCGTEGRGFETRLPPIIKKTEYNSVFFYNLSSQELFSVPIKVLFLVWKNI